MNTTNSHEETGRHQDLIRTVMAESMALQREAIDAARAEERASLARAEEFKKLQAEKQRENELSEQKIAADRDMRDEYAKFVSEEKRTHKIIEELMVLLRELIADNRAVLKRIVGDGGIDEKATYAGGELVYLNRSVRDILHHIGMIFTFLRMQLTHMDAIMRNMNVKLSQEERDVRAQLFATLDKAVSGKVTIANHAVGSVESDIANLVGGEQKWDSQ
jgi:hypothetical protein